MVLLGRNFGSFTFLIKCNAQKQTNNKENMKVAMKW